MLRYLMPKPVATTPEACVERPAFPAHLVLRPTAHAVIDCSTAGAHCT